jgi:hypothetical protein
MAYRNRHGCWGLVVFAGCDANCCYNIFSCMYSGSTSDCLACDICLQLTPQSWKSMIRSYLGFIVDFFFLCQRKGQHALRKCGHTLPLPCSMQGFSLFVVFYFFFSSLLYFITFVSFDIYTIIIYLFYYIITKIY